MKYFERKISQCILLYNHCVKSVHIWSFFWSAFSRMRTECGPKKLQIRTIFTQWIINRGVFRTLSIIWDKAFYRNFGKRLSGCASDKFMVSYNLNYIFCIQHEDINYPLISSNLLFFCKNNFIRTFSAKFLLIL